MRSRQETLGLIAVILGNSIFGFSFLFSKLALDITVPSVLIAVRFTVAFILLNIIVFLGRLIKNRQGEPLVAFSLKGKPRKHIIILAIFQPIIYFIAENYGIVYTSSSFAGIIIALIPIVGIVADMIFFKEKLRLNQCICALLSVGGVALTTIGAANMRSSVAGVCLLMIAVVAGSLFYVFSKQAGAYYNPLERTYVMFGLGSAFYIVFSLIQCHGRYGELIGTALMSPMFWISIAYLSAVSSVAAFLLLNFGSSHVSVTRATLLANLTTVISIFAGVLILKESFTLPQIVGAIVILVSVYWATGKQGKAS